MATKLYLPDGVAAPITPPAPVGSTTWEHINTGTNWLQAALLAPDASTLATVEYAPDGVDDLTDRDSFHRQYVIGPLKAQTFAGNVTAQLQCLERLANCNLILTMKIITCTPAGVLRNTLLAITRASAEANTSIRNLTYTSTALAASQTCQDGDYLVLEIGLGGNITSGTGGAVGHDGSIRWGCNASSGDLPVDNTQVGATYRGWVSFSTTIKFLSEAEGTATAGVGGANGIGAAFVKSEGSSTGAATVTGKGAMKPHNDFSNDPNCVALYKLESGALLTDSKGSNTLTASTSAPTDDASNYWEGVSAAHYAKANTQYHYRKDADLSSDFPLKSGTTNKTISIGMRLRIGTAPDANNDQNLVVKSCYVSPLHKRTIGSMIYNFNPGIKANWDAGDVNGDYSNNYVHDSALTVGEYYYLMFVFDDATLFAGIYIRDEVGNVIGTDATFTVDDHIALFSDSDFMLGLGGGDPSNLNARPLDGWLDEVAIFKDLVTPTETTALAKGLYAVTGGLIEATGSSTGSATADAISGATKLSEGSSTGTGTASADSQTVSVLDAEGSCVGAATLSGLMLAFVPATGGSDGLAAATGYSAYKLPTEGSSAGQATASADSQTVIVIETEGTSAGGSTITGAMNAAALTTGSSAGTGDASADSLILLPTVGSAAGSCTVLGDAPAGATEAEGTSAGSASVTGEGAGLRNEGHLAASAAILAGSGLVQVGAIIGTGVLLAATAEVNGAGLSSSSGSGVLAASAATVLGSGLSASMGTGSLLAEPGDLTGTGVSQSGGSGSLAAQLAVLEAEAIAASIGTGALRATPAQLQALAEGGSSGTGILVAGRATLAGVQYVVLLVRIADVSGSGARAVVHPARLPRAAGIQGALPTVSDVSGVL